MGLANSNIEYLFDFSDNTDIACQIWYSDIGEILKDLQHFLDHTFTLIFASF